MIILIAIIAIIYYSIYYYSLINKKVLFIYLVFSNISINTFLFLISTFY